MIALDILSALGALGQHGFEPETSENKVVLAGHNCLPQRRSIGYQRGAAAWIRTLLRDENG